MKYSINHTYFNNPNLIPLPRLDIICEKEEQVQVETQNRKDGKHLLYIHVDGITVLRLETDKEIEKTFP